jgi:molybdopterin synthase sulfur carrier subunit
MSTVRIPPVLRVSTGGQKLVEIGGSTVGQVLTTLVATHPGLGAQLFSADGELNRFINVFVNDTDIRHLETLATPVSDRDAIVLLPAMAGGCLLEDAGAAEVHTTERTSAQNGASRWLNRSAREGRPTAGRARTGRRWPRMSRARS